MKLGEAGVKEEEEELMMNKDRNQHDPSKSGTSDNIVVLNRHAEGATHTAQAWLVTEGGVEEGGGDVCGMPTRLGYVGQDKRAQPTVARSCEPRSFTRSGRS